MGPLLVGAMTAPMHGRHRRARLSLRARDRLELLILFGGLLAAATVLAVGVASAARSILDSDCAPIVIESTGTWQHDHAAVPGPDPDWGTFDCVQVTGLQARDDVSQPWDMLRTPPQKGQAQ